MNDKTSGINDKFRFLLSPFSLLIIGQAPDRHLYRLGYLYNCAHFARPRRQLTIWKCASTYNLASVFNLLHTTVCACAHNFADEPFSTPLQVASVDGYEAGMQLDVTAMFKEGDLLDVQGTSVGKGFQGGIKRHNFKRGLMTHGSKSHREHGALPNSSPIQTW
jgi:hypothetical protein